MSASRPYERVRFTAAALDDLDEIHRRSLTALREVFRQLRRLDRDEITPTPLRDFSKTGDLSDCGKIVVEVPDEPEYRVVVRRAGDGFDVVDVLVAEARADDLAHLLAALRLGRIADPVRRSDTERRVARLRRRLAPPPSAR